jgi:hypothetical protein
MWGVFSVPKAAKTRRKNSRKKAQNAQNKALVGLNPSL